MVKQDEVFYQVLQSDIPETKPKLAPSKSLQAAPPTKKP
jgi:hypothetical protein